jgi:SNF2 family DNA or RNA helicase
MPADYELSAPLQKAYNRLLQIRESTNLTLKPCPFIQREVEGLDGQLAPFSFRYYQVQGVFHLMVLHRILLGDGTGLGKTIEALGALSFLWATVEPSNKVLVISPKSAIRQWAGEITKFTKGVRPIIAGADKRKGESPVEARERSYREWADAPTGPDDPKVVLILNYALLVRDWDHGGFQPLKDNGKPDPKKPVVPGLLDGITRQVAKNLVVIFDEAQAFKNIRTKTWEKARYLSDRAHRVIGLTATLLKNHLFEGYCIYKVIKPDLFSTQTKFRDDYCFYEMKRVKGNRKIPIILGYKNLEHFRKTIDPFFLGRPKHVVSDELPTLTTREVVCELDRTEDLKYGEALTGLLELGDGELRDFEETKALTSLIYAQQVVNSLALLKYTEGQEVGAKAWDFDNMQWDTYKVGSLGSKEQALLDLVSGELDHEKIIVYTRFESLVGRLQKILAKEKIKSVRITGKENDKTRRKAQEVFQKHDSDVRVIFITDAGSEAINLQAAAAMVFYDMPWSWGNYVQTLGRMIRIGSPHKGVLAFHLIAERPALKRKARKTIDQYVLAGLRKKKNLIDKVLGEAAVGALKFDKQGASVRDLVRAMQKGAKAA